MSKPSQPSKPEKETILSKENPIIDFDRLQQNINARMDEKNNGEDPTALSADGFMPNLSGFGGSTTPVAPAPEPHVHTEESLELVEPFMILQFTHTPTEEEGVFGIDSFKLNLGGINPTPEAILAHLKMAVSALEEHTPEDELVPDSGE